MVKICVGRINNEETGILEAVVTNVEYLGSLSQNFLSVPHTQKVPAKIGLRRLLRGESARNFSLRTSNPHHPWAGELQEHLFSVRMDPHATECWITNDRQYNLVSDVLVDISVEFTSRRSSSCSGFVRLNDRYCLM